MSEFRQMRKKFENQSSGKTHVVINVNNKDEESNILSQRRISIGTLEWLNGKVETLRRKFSAAAQTEAEHKNYREKVANRSETGRKLSTSDGDLIEICRKYQICSENKYTWISEPFESIVTEYGQLVRSEQIEIHRDSFEEPGMCARGVLLMPLSPSTGLALLDFSEMGGFSLGRGSRVAKKASRALSRNHCMIYLENNLVCLKDCDSKTGTFVNGRLLGSSVPTLLENFDIVQMGYGGNAEDFIQTMAVFLESWNPKEFAASSLSQQFNMQSSYSRTFSNSFATLKFDQSSEIGGKKMVSPLVSSPRLTQISGQVIAKPELSIETETDFEEEPRAILFEKPRPCEIEEINHYSNLRTVKSPVDSETTISNDLTGININSSGHSNSKNTYCANISNAHFNTSNTHRNNIANIVSPPPIPKQPSPQKQVKKEPRQMKELFSPLVTECVETVPINSLECTSHTQLSNQQQQQPTESNDQFKVNYHNCLEATSKVQTPKKSSRKIDSALPLSASPRPPVPKPRQMKKGLSKSAECLIEMDLQELALTENETEVEDKGKLLEPFNVSKSSHNQKTTGSVVTTRTVKMPLQSALAARSPPLSLQQQKVLNVAIPDFLKTENLKIPAISPAQDLLIHYESAHRYSKNVQRKFGLAVSRKRGGRIEKSRDELKFEMVVQGANTKRFEFAIDFGSTNGDISDGFALGYINGKESVRMTFNNFRINWAIESLNSSTKSKLILSHQDRNCHELFMEGCSGADSFKIGIVEADLKKSFAKITFKIDDIAFKGITGAEIDTAHSLPLKALDQLTYFYPHLELPFITFQGSPNSPHTPVLIFMGGTGNKKSVQIGKLVFEAQKISWQRRLLIFAVDLDTKEVEIHSILCDSIQMAALLYCLRCHID